MHGNAITGAIASIAASIDDALVAGRPTAALRAELRRLEQEQRTDNAKAAAEERARRTEQEAAEQAEINAKATALLDEVKARIASRTAPLALSSARTVRRYPSGEIEAVAINTEHEDA